MASNGEKSKQSWNNQTESRENESSLPNSVDPLSHKKDNVHTQKSIPLGSRLLLKLSGEVFLNATALDHVLDQIVGLQKDYTLHFVVGGGNILRGSSGAFKRSSRLYRDATGMHASVLNALLLKAHLQEKGLTTTVIAPYTVPGAAELFDEKTIATTPCIFGGGTGQPFVTTDTAAVLMALKAGCTYVLKGTKVSGVFDADPATHTDAIFLPRLTHSQALEQNLGFMDATALALARDHDLILRVFHIMKKEGVTLAIKGLGDFTDVSEKE